MRLGWKLRQFMWRRSWKISVWPNESSEAYGRLVTCPLRVVQVSVCGRVVILQGQVPSYNLKQAAQAAALAVLGIEELRNDLEVVP
jgi:osmotically-inducible protein OsmY